MSPNIPTNTKQKISNREKSVSNSEQTKVVLNKPLNTAFSISTNYFRDEVRSGFYIPTAIKQVWATGLAVLAEIDRICRKHNINYYAEWGTFLGAVRHGGFIPWDDDLDIGMRREDYNKFRLVADQELPKEFVIHDYERKENHWLFLSRVVNKGHICFDEEHLKKYHNYPYMSAVDIFVVDYLYKEEEKEKERCDEIMQIIALAEQLLQQDKGNIANNARMPASAKKTLAYPFTELEHKYGITINRTQTIREICIDLYRLAEQQMARVPESESERMGQIFPWVIKGDRGLPKELYRQTIRMPFEETEIPVLADYDTVLRARYWDYFKLHKVWTGHDYPYFEKQKLALYEKIEFDIPEFQYNKELDFKWRMQQDSGKECGEDLRSLAKDCVLELQKMTHTLVMQVKDEMFDSVARLLPECQQLAVDCATLIESVKGETNPGVCKVVESLQKYCDALFQLYQVLTNGSQNIETELETIKQRNCLQEIEQEVERLQEITNKEILDKPVVVFATLGSKEWQGFEWIYQEHLKKEDDIYVVPLPLLPKEPLGTVACTAAEIKEAVGEREYPSDIPLTKWTELNLELLRPDIIYVQNPYDGENPYLTVPDKFYSSNLKQYTEQLIYIPAFTVEEFTPKDITTLYNMKHYVTVPGVMYADEIWVQSENMRLRYMEKLLEFAGENTREIWEHKLIVFENKRVDEVEKNKNAEKRMLFCIGLNEMSDKNNCILEKIKEKLEIIQSCQDESMGMKLHVDVCFYPMNDGEWKRVNEKLSEQISEMVLESVLQGTVEPFNGEITSEIVDAYDAYYGSPSPMVHWFNYAGKPVMIW